MIRFDFVSCVPELLCSPLAGSILARAQARGLLEVGFHDLHDYSDNKHGRVDDAPYGGGGGMVLQVAPIAEALHALRGIRAYDAVVMTSPGGQRFDQRMAMRFSKMDALLILCGHYQGMDERVRTLGLVDLEVSIGDYVLTGGELAALVICDAVVRLLPGVVGDGQSVLGDSFQDEKLAAPLYTRPLEYEGAAVPSVLCSGDAQAIRRWREQAAERRTQQQRPDLMAKG